MAEPAGPRPEWALRSAPVGAVPPGRERFSWTALGIAGGLVLFAYYAWLWLVRGEPAGAALFLGPLLVAFSVPVLVRANRLATGFDLAGVLLVSLVLRFAFAWYRFTHAVDAWEYHSEGVRLARFYRTFNFSVDPGKDIPGTGAMRAISGGVHVLVNDDFFASFLVMTWLGFLGCWLLYRAFDISIADGDRYRYARLVLLWPSMCFWPASLGKDAWMVLTIGIAAYGAARVFRRMMGGYTLLAVGLLASSFVRPHLALLALVAFVAALVVGRRHELHSSGLPSLFAKIVGLALVLVIGSVLVSRTQRILDIEDFDASSIERASTEFAAKTDVGEATFDAPNPRSPFGFVEATVTTLFRPFPTEAAGTEQILTAFEGLALAILSAASARRLLTLRRRLRPQPYVMLALVYVLLWILAFGVIGNFGILARQRTQMLPFYFVLLSVSAVLPARGSPGTLDEPLALR